VTDDKRMKSQRAALQLAASIAEVSNVEKAEQVAKQAADDDELLDLDLATKSLAKLRKNNMDWAKLTRKEMRCLALKYLNTRIDKNAKKGEVVIELEQAYEHAQPNARAQFDQAYVWLNWFKNRDLLGVSFQRYSTVSNWKPLETQTSSFCEFE
jgi:hypothetical protein